jgi:inner membrane protein
VSVLSATAVVVRTFFFTTNLVAALAIVLLYGYLYALLVNQDYALLAGSIGLFLLLATVMFLTRKIDWRRVPTSTA